MSVTENVPAQQRAPRRAYLMMTLEFLLASWLGVVHALAVLPVAALLLRNPDLDAALRAAYKAYAQNLFPFIAAIGGPGMALWMIKDMIGWSLLPLGPAGRQKHTLAVLVTELVLLMWILLVHTAALGFILLLGHDPQAVAIIVRAFTDGQGLKPVILSIVLVAGPSIALFMKARWARWQLAHAPQTGE